MEEHVAAAGFAAVKLAAKIMSQAYREGNAASLAHMPADQRVAAYLVIRMPGTYAAAAAVLREVRERISGGAIGSVLDVGTGTGAASLAARATFAEASQFTLIERDRNFGRLARQFLPDAEIRIEDFTRIKTLPPHDLVIAAYSLGESLAPEIAARMWEATRVAMVVIEPGSPSGFALVRDIRALLLREGGAMLAPCPAEGPCPIAAPDWCHFAARVERTSLVRRMKDAELSYEDEKFSYIAGGREPVALAPARIVRRPRVEPGLITLEVCAPQGLQTIRIPKRDRDAFRAARRAAWGDPFAPL